MKIVDGIKPFLEWQSDAAYKKGIPQGYYYPSFDMFGNLAKLRSNFESGKYSDEYEFQLDLFEKVSAPGSDGHFKILPDLLKKFRWIRQPLAIVSISEDEEAVASPKTAQVITKINGIDASKYIEDTTNLAPGLQDFDAAYNSMFWSKAVYGSTKKVFGNFVAGGRISLLQHGTTTNITFANSTTTELKNKAAVLGNMTGIVDGPSMYKHFCMPPMDPPSNALLRSPDSAEATEDNHVSVHNHNLNGQGLGAIGSLAANDTPQGYPDPILITKDGAVSGYYLSGQGFEDVAVIALTPFEASTLAEFQAVVGDFLLEARAAGKTKLIVDFQSNPGGCIFLSYDFFRQLFPSILQDGYSRWKLNSGFLAMSRVISEHAEDKDLATRPYPDFASLLGMWFNFRSGLNLTYHEFSTFEVKFGPHFYKDTNYSALTRWNLRDPRITTNKTTGMGIEISGYGSHSNLT
ncbi:hypothetical protein QQS21_003134 [Conoideocrella luteorostrata]|uniref:CPAF-like PDZ domain-containing protein n=1 Tax=Conoideocrella luteorostrata TaxID=1105319 RepID=A0AAJ0G2G6_9HYPO|nr:hypothetical protein QQS21_003134 [Conoideocrella luteorostrata]